MSIPLDELRHIENKALHRALSYVDDYCAKSDIAIPTSKDKGFDILKLIAEIKRLS